MYGLMNVKSSDEFLMHKI